VLLAATAVRADDDAQSPLREQIESQGKEIQALQEELRQKMQAVQPAAAEADPSAKALDADAVKKIVAGYLQDNPGAGMPPSVQTGFETGKGFVIRSAPNPKYVQWDDDCKIPFELRIKGRMMISYMNYRVTDPRNHVTNTFVRPASGVGVAEFSQLEAKRVNFIFAGTAFDPDLRYLFELLGSTRGLPGFQNNKVLQTAGAANPAGNTSSPNATLIGGGVLVDHAVTLFQAFVAYDFHPCSSWKGCGPDCCDGTYRYQPTFTVFAGKIKPFFGLDEFLGNANQQFVDFSMADIMFDADDDTRLMAAGIQVKAAEDRFFLWSAVTNGSDAFLPNTFGDDYPGLITSFWYDLGGSWNEDKKAWDLYGDCLNDIDYSCKPVARVGAGMDLVPLDHRALYGDQEQARYFVMPGAPGGTRLINLLNGDAIAPNGSHAVDKFNAYAFNAFWSAKYRGFSITNEWWLRELTGFHTRPDGKDVIVYQDNLGPGGAAVNALFPNKNLVDYGSTIQAGYFIIPKKLEVAARFSFVRGDSGDINGNGKFKTMTVPGVGALHVVDGAFRQMHEAREYTVGVNYFFKRHLLKWQTDVGYYEGGNPAGSPAGTSVTGWIAGQDGWLLRTQIQLAF
jgi:hypothetical protein